MTVLTVDDLARDLKVKNEDLLKELVTMGFSVDGPDSPLEIDDPSALRAHLITAIPKREVVEQRIRPTVIRRRAKTLNLLAILIHGLRSNQPSADDLLLEGVSLLLRPSIGGSCQGDSDYPNSQ